MKNPFYKVIDREGYLPYPSRNHVRLTANTVRLFLKRRFIAHNNIYRAFPHSSEGFICFLGQTEDL